MPSGECRVGRTPSRGATPPPTSDGSAEGRGVRRPRTPAAPHRAVALTPSSGRGPSPDIPRAEGRGRGHRRRRVTDLPQWHGARHACCADLGCQPGQAGCECPSRAGPIVLARYGDDAAVDAVAGAQGAQLDGRRVLGIIDGKRPGGGCPVQPRPPRRYLKLLGSGLIW